MEENGVNFIDLNRTYSNKIRRVYLNAVRMIRNRAFPFESNRRYWTYTAICGFHSILLHRTTLGSRLYLYWRLAEASKFR